MLCHLVAQLKSAIEESRAINEELQRQYASLEENLKRVEAEKLVGDSCVWLSSLLLLQECSMINKFLKCRMPLGLMEMKRKQGLLLRLPEMSIWKILEGLSWRKNALMIRSYFLSRKAYVVNK